MTKKYKRKSIEVIAIQFSEAESHPAVKSKLSGYYFSNGTSSEVHENLIMTHFGEVLIEYGDWVVEINGKIKVLKDEYFKEHYELVPEKVNRAKLIIATGDCV